MDFVYAAEDAVNKFDSAMFRDLQSKGILASERSLGQAVYNHLSIIQDPNASIGDLFKALQNMYKIYNDLSIYKEGIRKNGYNDHTYSLNGSAQEQFNKINDLLLRIQIGISWTGAPQNDDDLTNDLAITWDQMHYIS